MSLTVSTKDEHTTKPIMSIRDLTVSFSTPLGFLGRRSSILNAVDHVSFDIYPSETLSLVGESGSGKTTTARSIMGLIGHYSGSITYNGMEVSTLRGKSLLDYRRQVQVIYQDPYESLNPRETIYSTVSTPVRLLTGETDPSRLLEIVSNLLDEVGLEAKEVIHKHPHQLSGGERQRVNIARALAPKPKLLVADEPVTMLDASQKVNILSLLLQLKLKRNLTMLLITHDLASARIMSERTAIMYLGKIVEMGPTNAILSKPRHPYAELILSCTPRLGNPPDVDNELLMSIEESQRVESGCIFRPRCRYATAICEKVEPPLEEKSHLHLAACHNPLG